MTFWAMESGEDGTMIGTSGTHVASSLVDAASPSTIFFVLLLIGFVLAILVFAMLLINRLGRSNPDLNQGLPPSLETGKSPKTRGGSEVEKDPITVDMDRPGSSQTAELTSKDMSDGKRRPPIPSMEDIRVLEGSNPLEAAVQWGLLSRWKDAARCYLAGNDLREAARIYLSVGEFELAEEILTGAISKSPGDEKTRLMLVGIHLDKGRRSKAVDLIDAVTDPDSALKPSADFLSQAARQFEAANDLEYAHDLYRQALQLDDSLPEIQQRVLFLKHIQRLATDINADPGSDEPQALMQKYLADTHDGITMEELENLPDEKEKVEAARESSMSDHDVIVGHLALGCQREEPTYSVQSIFALSRRFNIQRLMSESGTGAVFDATDELLDFPVALKLFRLPDMNPDQYQTLKDRLRLIAQLNHPNLAKLTFADRQGQILRVATEFLPGGNLRDFLQKLGGVGIPLLVRMGMHLASALHTAHIRGVPHGDIRPENILIGPDQRIKLIDFSHAPIPICKLDDKHHSSTESLDTPRLADLLGSSESVQADLVQLGDVLEFMLENAREGSLAAIKDKGGDGNDPVEELREVVHQLRNGSFTSVLRLWQVLEQIFDRTMQSSSDDHSSKV